MSFNVDFEKQDCCFSTDFGEVQSADAGGYDKGYEIGYGAGHEKGYTEGEKVGYGKGYTDGQESVPNYLYYGSSFQNTFAGAGFPENLELVFRVQRLTGKLSFAGTFSDCVNLKSIKLINESNTDLAISMQSTFACGVATTPTLEFVDLTEFNKKFSNGHTAFRNQTKLKSVYGKIDLSESIGNVNMFYNCEALEDVEFESETIKLSISFAQSSNLSFASIQSIFGGLATVETAQTLTLAPAQKVLQSQIDSANAKGWTVVGGTVVQEAW